MRIVTAIFTIFSSMALWASVQTALQPSSAPVGTTLSLTLQSNEGAPRLMAFPTVPGITWMNQQPQSRSNVQIVNGRRTQTFQATYTLRATRVGKITLPVMRVHLPNRPNQRYSTPQLQVTATSVDKFAQLRLL